VLQHLVHIVTAGLWMFDSAPTRG